MSEEQVLTPAEKMLRSQARARVRAPIAGNQIGLKLQAVLDRVDILEEQFAEFETPVSDGDDAGAQDNTRAVLAEMQAQLNDIAARVELLEGMLPSADAFEALCGRVAALEEKPEIVPSPVAPEGYDMLVERVNLLDELPDKMGALEARVIEMAKPKRAPRKRTTKAKAE